MPSSDASVAAFIVPYEQDWGRQGIELAAELQEALAPLALRVEHIGSTSIPGMAAKPVFDLQVSVAGLEAAAAAFDGPLAGLGFSRLPYEQDHVPAGCDDAPQLWAKRYWNRRRPGLAEVNLHCRLAGSPNERLALLFRDWFRAHPHAVPAYARFKEVLAAAVGDLGVYTDVKDPVVDLVVAVAEEWAATTGWSPGGSAPGRSAPGRSAPGRSAPGRSAPGRFASGR
ncbi:GrpB family protein [Actinoplanes sp. NBC_00393]|uniref:GrpB family protein n=1 Tax=Actinoplanes sp. NBC_00393 TaxID=2975953 RepID=UPI002E1C5C8A